MAENQNSSNLDLENTISKSEDFINKNKKSLLIIVGAVLVGIIGIWYYNGVYLKDKEKEAAAAMYKAEDYFAKDSLKLALDGDGSAMGFAAIADEYSMTKSGNLAHYYAGMTLLKLGRFQDAIEKLSGYDADDLITPSLALGAIGDAYLELNNMDDAISYYRKASKEKVNNFSTPIMLQKLASALELKGDNKEAAEIYRSIKKDYPSSQEGQNAEKYASRAEAKIAS
ncbi:MAG: hypothetical protein RIQ89_2384 [Bacteroidota bacterium]|jgi:TolA-binding protein